jgi:hypothetical protein
VARSLNLAVPAAAAVLMVMENILENPSEEITVVGVAY